MNAIRSELRQKLEAIGLTSHVVFPSSREYVEEWDDLKPEGFSQEEIVEIMDALLPVREKLVLSRDVSACQRPTTDARTPKELVGMKDSLNDALETIEMFANAAGGACSRIPPLVYTSTSKGGKTSFLLQLFDALKNSVRFLPMYVIFSEETLRLNEPTRDALNRHIALQLCEVAAHSVIDETELYEHIHRSSNGKPVILLLDDISVLGTPLHADAFYLLTNRWLDPENRFLVCISSGPYNLEAGVSPGPSDDHQAYAYYCSRRGFHGAKQTRCLNPQTLSNMFPAEERIAVTPADAAICGGIPSLVRVETESPGYAQRNFIARDIMQNFPSGIPPPQVMNIVPEQNEIRWPITYIQLIFDVYGDDYDVGLGALLERRRAVWAGRTGPHLDWVMVVQVGILLKCLYAKICGGSGPFGIADHGDKNVDKIVALEMGPDVNDVDQADKFLCDFLYKHAPGTLLVATPTSPTFPTFDGFVYVVAENRNIRKVGYQSDLYKPYPAGPVPAFLDAALQVRHPPGYVPPVLPVLFAPIIWYDQHYPTCMDGSLEWRYLTDKKLISLLGVSLAELRSPPWPAHPCA